MKTVLQLNTMAGHGSIGRIAEQIGKLATADGWTCWMGHGRGETDMQSVQVGSKLDMVVHGVATRLADRHGLQSKRATRRLIDFVEREVRPDIVHLHNVHGYYLHYPELFGWLSRKGIPVVWTLHDCWTMTGHCAHFTSIGCDRWRTGCHDCPSKCTYPASLFLDRSKSNYRDKLKAFTMPDNVTIVAVSDWLAGVASESFLSKYPVVTIKNGINLDAFKPVIREADGAPYVLGVAGVWNVSKGLPDFIKLRAELPERMGIKLVGLTDKQIKELPEGIEGIRRTTSCEELAALYTGAVALVNPTWEDSYPTVNLEAQACGTPVVTYRTGGSPESLTPETGIVVEQGDVSGLCRGVSRFESADRGRLSVVCREHALSNFDCNRAFEKYLELYNSLID